MCRRALAPLVDAGFVEFVYGGGAEGAFLTKHPLARPLATCGTCKLDHADQVFALATIRHDCDKTVASSRGNMSEKPDILQQCVRNICSLRCRRGLKLEMWASEVVPCAVPGLPSMLYG